MPIACAGGAKDARREFTEQARGIYLNEGVRERDYRQRRLHPRNIHTDREQAVT